VNKYVLSLFAASSIAALAGSQSAHAAATELCAGPAIVSGGPITNGSTCNLQSTGTTVSELFIGKSANDTDILKLGATSIFNNQATNPGTFANQTVTAGSVLNFSLDNTNDALGPATYSTGTAYTNVVLPFGISNGLSPVYHFAFFDLTSAADVNSIFGAPYINATFDSIIKSAGGYSSFVFVGIEDSPVDTSDDWNDTIYAFQNVAPVGTTGGGSGSTPAAPEPSTWVMMIMGFAGLGFAGSRASRKSAVTA
jgi:PEP-CTERM motif